MLNEQQMAMTMVLRERARQEQKWGVQTHSLERWIAILVEEIGEVAQVANRYADGEDKHLDSTVLVREVTQVAAVSLAWMEQIMRERRGKHAEGVAGADAGQAHTGG